MPVLDHEKIFQISRRVLMARGAPDNHATTVARHLANANLAGHDSHGFLRIPQYVSDIDVGRIDPRAQPEVVSETAGTARVNGHNTFGQVAATFATEVGISKARQTGISLVTMTDLGHTGRIGSYPEIAAREGMASIMYTGFIGGVWANNVAPFGGRERRLGTNPISMGFPYSSDGPVLLDFATSVAAEGKLRVYRARGHSLPDTWVLDKDGVPSDDPNAYYAGGAILPLGGLAGGHKGYALGLMTALFGAIMSGVGTPDPGDLRQNLRAGSCIIVMDVGGMAPIDKVKAQVAEVVDYVKDTPLMEGVSEVLYPGEIEARTRRERLANGVDIEQATWDAVAKLIDEYGLREELAPLP